ncbi:MAG: SDR family NAD(P)-dependent oxidoreductase [Pseudomonadota bacterium]
MNKRFEGRTALVTGATSGIGRATLKMLLAGGARVIGTGRREERLNSLKDEAQTDALLTRRLDMMDVDAVDNFWDALPGEFSPDILINNAGLALGLSGAASASLADWDQMIATNVTGLVHLTRAALPSLQKKPRADVVNISSVAATYPYPGGNTYGGTKAFVQQFSLNLKADLLGSSVRVTSVEPGMTDTEFSTVRFEGDKEKADHVYDGMKPLSGEDVAQVIGDILALPSHVNINRVELMPVQQAFSPFAVHRG